MAGMNYVQWPITIKLNPGYAEIDGVRINYMVLAEIVSELIHPDPRKWIRLERSGDILNVHVKFTEEEPDGTRIATTESQTDTRGTGTEAAH